VKLNCTAVVVVYKSDECCLLLPFFFLVVHVVVFSNFYVLQIYHVFSTYCFFIGVVLTIQTVVKYLTFVVVEV